MSTPRAEGGKIILGVRSAPNGGWLKGGETPFTFRSAWRERRNPSVGPIPLRRSRLRPYSA